MTLDTNHYSVPARYVGVRVTLKAYFSATDFSASQLQSLLRYTLDSSGVTMDVTPLAFQDWGENWKQHFKPFYIAPKVLVSPSWETPHPQSGDTVITLDPGMAFGTGLHATTRLCAELLTQELRRTPEAAVLDVGCGSGILSILAAKLGAATVTACDIDSIALDVCRENLERNRLTDPVALFANLEETTGTYPIIVANILLSTLTELKGALLQRLAPGGSLILSGVLDEQEKTLLEAFSNLQCVRKEYQDEWACYLLTL